MLSGRCPASDRAAGVRFGTVGVHCPPAIGAPGRHRVTKARRELAGGCSSVCGSPGSGEAGRVRTPARVKAMVGGREAHSGVASVHVVLGTAQGQYLARVPGAGADSAGVASYQTGYRPQ